MIKDQTANINRCRNDYYGNGEPYTIDNDKIDDEYDRKEKEYEMRKEEH